MSQYRSCRASSGASTSSRSAVMRRCAMHALQRIWCAVPAPRAAHHQPGTSSGARTAAPQRPQGVQDDRDVDGLLEQRADHDRQVPEGRDDHRHERQTHARRARSGVRCVRERRAIWTASVSRSSRSTVITMSAASDAAVAPRAPIATPDVRDRQRGRVVHAVADHDDGAVVRCRSCSNATASTFSSGLRSASTPSSPIANADHLRDRRAVTGDHHDPRESRPPQARTARGVSGRTGSSSTSAPGVERRRPRCTRWWCPPWRLAAAGRAPTAGCGLPIAHVVAAMPTRDAACRRPCR